MKILSFIILFICCLCYPSPVFGLVGDTEKSFGIDGSLRTTAARINISRLPSFFTENITQDHSLQTILRLIAAGRPSNSLSYEIHLVQGHFVPPYYDVADLTIIPEKTRYQAIDLSQNWYEGENSRATLWFDRFNAKLSLSSADVTIGRQAITFGKAYFWNPLDIFSPFSPQQLDRDYKAGVDAIRLDIPMGNFSGFNLINVFGPEIPPPWQPDTDDKNIDMDLYGSAVLARLYTTIADWDFSLQFGKIYGGGHLGFGATGEIGWLETRFEAAMFTASQNSSFPDNTSEALYEDYTTVVLGVGHRFENSLTYEIEYLYNGASDDNDLETSLKRFTYGGALHISEQLVGGIISYEFLPIAIGQIACIYSISDRSIQIQPSFSVSLTDEVDLLVAGTFSRGDRPYQQTIQIGPYQIIQTRIASEFGTYPDVYYIELKFYF